MIIKTIRCEKCGKEETVKGDNKGFPGWGHIAGAYNDETGEEIAHICPDCKFKIIIWLNGGTI